MAERPAPILFERLRSVHNALNAAGIEHALGGALALGIHVRDPRFTSDIDLNITADPERPEDLFAVLPKDIQIHPSAAEEVRNDGQTRLWWTDPNTPLDLFLPVYGEFHNLVASRAEPADFLGDEIKVVSATDLMVFKALFGRSKDWVDIESLIRDSTADPIEAAGWVERISGDSMRAERVLRIVDLVRNPDLGIEIGPGERSDNLDQRRAKTRPTSTPGSWAPHIRGEGP
jgi:hypothetical protein